MIQKTWAHHGTKLIGFAGLVVSSALAVEGLVPHEQMKWLVFANLVLSGLTVKRGFRNSKAQTPNAGT